MRAETTFRSVLAPAITAFLDLKRALGGQCVRETAAVLRTGAAAVQRSHSALGASYRRLLRRKGYRVAVFATARKQAQLVCRMLRRGQDYVDIGEQACGQRFRQQRVAGMKRAAESLGYLLVPLLTRTLSWLGSPGLLGPQPGFSRPNRKALLQEETGGPDGRRDGCNDGPWSLGEFRPR